MDRPITQLRKEALMSDKSVEQMEQYVRERWMRVCLIKDMGYLQISMWGGKTTEIKESPTEAWQLAYAFTRRREQEIREKREEVEWVKLMFNFSSWKEWHSPMKRILSILEAQLAELLKGFKEIRGKQ